MRSRQIKTTGEALFANLPEGDLPDTITVDGIEFTVEQISKINNTIIGPITVQRMRGGKLAVRGERFPLGIWAIYEPDGDFSMRPEPQTGGKSMTQNDPYTHVYHRIAESVTKRLGAELGVEIFPEQVEDLLRDHARPPMNEKIEEAIIAEAKEYGLELDVDLSEYKGDGSDLTPEQFATWSKKYGGDQ